MGSTTTLLSPQAPSGLNFLIKGPSGELFGSSGSQFAMSPDSGYFFAYSPQSGLSSGGSKYILDTNYLLSYYNGNVLFFDRNNSLISGIPLISANETWQTAATQYSAVPAYRRIA